MVFVSFFVTFGVFCLVHVLFGINNTMDPLGIKSMHYSPSQN